jgi:hypothetical protein
MAASASKETIQPDEGALEKGAVTKAPKKRGILTDRQVEFLQQRTGTFKGSALDAGVMTADMALSLGENACEGVALSAEVVSIGADGAGYGFRKARHAIRPFRDRFAKQPFD